MAHIDRVPDELLVHICEFGARATLEDDGLPFAVLASHVSRRWRALTQTTHAVWRFVPVRRTQHLDLLAAFLSRSAAYPLDVFLHAERRAGLREAVDMVLAHGPRIARLAVRASSTPMLFLVFLRLERARGTLARLAAFELSCAPGMRPLTIPDGFGSALPALATLALRNARFGPGHPAMAGLTTLALSDFPPAIRLTHTAFRTLLAASPALRHLALDAASPSLIPLRHFMPGSEYPEIRVPALVSLEIVSDDGDGPWALLQTMAAPALHTLAVSCGHAWRSVELEQALSERLGKNMPALRELHLTVSALLHRPISNAEANCFVVFTKLSHLSISVLADEQAEWFLTPRIKDASDCSMATDDDDVVWPDLRTLAIHAPLHAESSLRDTMETFTAIRLSINRPLQLLDFPN